jgi:hypothetical protein
LHSTKTESESRATTDPAARSKSRAQAAAKSKSALPILKSSLKSPSSQATGAAAASDDRRRARWASLSKSPAQTQQLEGIRASSGAAPEQLQQPPSGASSDHASPTKMNIGAVPSTDAGASAGSALQHQHPAAAPAILPPPAPSSSQPPDRSSHPAAPPRSVSAPAPPTGRKLRHLFRRPPVRSASDPPLYSYSAMRPVTDGGGLKRPVSEVVPAPRREVVERRMPRLPSARDLLRKLT